MSKIQPVLFAISLIFNALLLAFFALAAFQRSAFLSFYNLDEEKETYTTAAALASVPAGAEAAFGPVTITMKQGERAALQFSAVHNKRQANRLVNALYDHAVISCQTTGYGLVITALQQGETSMQTIDEDGIGTIAIVRVTGE